MTVLVAAALAFGLSPLQQATPVLANAKATPEQARAFLADGFASHDLNRSGHLDPAEASRLEPRDSYRDRRLAPAPAVGQRDPEAEKKWMAKLDENRDGRVSEAEYISYMIPWIMLQGVPAGWKPNG